MESHFQRLLDDLPRIRHAVNAVESPNIEDDRAIKFAIVGYSYHQPAGSWGREEFDFVSLRRGEVMDFGPAWVEFVCLAAGYLLGLYQTGGVTLQQCALYEAQLPGFMWLHASEFTEAEPPRHLTGAGN